MFQLGESSSLKISALNLHSHCHIDCYKKSHNWFAWNIFHTDQYEIKIMNKNSIWTFCF